MLQPLDVCCFGFISMLRLLKVDKYPEPNSGTLVTDIFGVVTPDAPIVALLLSRLQLSVGLVSNTVGNDLDGRRLVELLSSYKIRSTVAVREGIHTPHTVVICDGEENRTWFSFLPDISANLLSIDLEMLRLPRLAYIDAYTITNTASLRALKFVAQHKTPLFVNLGGDPLTIDVIEVLREARLVAVQTSWGANMATSPDSLLHEIREKLNPPLAIVTLAREGIIYAAAGNGTLRVPAFTFQTMHSSGAGAAFSSGLLYALLMDWELERSLLFASALGGMYCTVPNGFEVLSLDDVLAFLDRQEVT